MKALVIPTTALRGLLPAAMAALLTVCPAALLKAQKSKPSAPAPKPAAAPASHPSMPAVGGASRGNSGAPAVANRGGASTPGASRGPSSSTTAGRGPTTNSTAGRGPANASGASRGPSSGTGTPHSSTTTVGGRGSTGGGMNSSGRGPSGGGSNAGGRGAGNSAHMVGNRPAPPGGRVHEGRAGAASFDRRGNVRDVHARGMDIHHGPGGSRTIVRERAGGVRVVSYRGGGYIAHPYRYGGVEYVHRTYWVGGVAYTHVYRPYFWGGVALNVYAPGFYFAPAYYGWAYNPWRAPIVYAGWGWAGTPWFGFYGGWFNPYPTYAGPAWWLTDYFVSQTLIAAYQAQAAASAAAAAATYSAPLTPDVKDLIAAEVQRQLALENQEAAAGVQATPDPGSSGIARMLSDGTQHVFVVSAGLDVQSNAGGECFVTEGDVLQLRGTVPPGQPASLTVLASKGQDCPKGSTVQVQVADLQEMQNHMRETVDAGLSDLQKRQGQGGIPAAPAGSTAPPQQTAYAKIAPPPDPNVQSEIQSQNQEADQAEKDVLTEAKQEAGGPSDSGAAYAPAAPPPHAPAKKITIGMSVDEVKAAWGEPKDIVDLGTKKIFVYDGMKFTFVNGKLTAAQ
jgi:hypothetical protein